jgi:hypothetical protein
MKVLKSIPITPFGGINFVIKEFNRLKINTLLEDSLPKLAPQSKYSWKDIIYSLWSVFFCGGNCAEDLAFNLKTAFENNPLINCPSPDRVLQRIKELSLPGEYMKSKSSKRYHHRCYHDPLTKLNITVLKELSLLEKDNLVLDYDNTYIFNDKNDATFTYKKSKGYHPGVFAIGNNIVSMENWSGYSDAMSFQKESIDRMFELLNSEGIKVSTFRADSASYKYDTIASMIKHTQNFFVRARLNTPEMEAICNIAQWNKFIIDDQVCYRGEIDFLPFEYTIQKQKLPSLCKRCRLVVTKEKRRDGQINAETGEAYSYSAIITNNTDMTMDQVVHFYNQRGAFEKEFDIVKNDFGWNNMPFSTMESNTVFLMLMAICRNVYNSIIKTFSKRYKGIKPTYRMKRFIFRFICIPAKWVKSSRTMKLRIYGNLDAYT